MLCSLDFPNTRTISAFGVLNIYVKAKLYVKIVCFLLEITYRNIDSVCMSEHEREYVYVFSWRFENKRDTCVGFLYMYYTSTLLCQRLLFDIVIISIELCCIMLYRRIVRVIYAIVLCICKDRAGAVVNEQTVLLIKKDAPSFSVWRLQIKDNVTVPFREGTEETFLNN